MTFEEYLEDNSARYALYGPLDTPEKLARCKASYQQHLRYIEANNYFEPQTTLIPTHDTNNYHKELYALLGFEEIAPGEILFLSMPSFYEESLLRIKQDKEQYSLTLISCPRNLSTAKYKRTPFGSNELKTYSGILNKDRGDQLFHLVTNAITEAQATEGKGIILDGVIYYISQISGGVRKTAKQHSPPEGSRSRRLIELLELAATMLTTEDRAGIEQQMDNMIIQLTT